MIINGMSGRIFIIMNILAISGGPPTQLIHTTTDEKLFYNLPKATFLTNFSVGTSQLLDR